MEIERHVVDSICFSTTGWRPCSIMMVGSSSSAEDLLPGHEALGDRLVRVPVPPMPPAELMEILTHAERILPLVWAEGVKELSKTELKRSGVT